MNEQLKQSLSLSIKEGVLAQGMIIIMDVYTIPFALFLGATPQQIGLLVAIPHLTASIVQIFSVEAVQIIGSRLQFLKKGLIVQIFFILPIGFLAFLPPKGHVELLILFVTIYRILMALIGPPWGSLVSDYLPAHERGEYFGRRSKWVAISGVISLIAWGTLLYLLKKISPIVGFVVLFLFASLFRMGSYFFMARLTDLPLKSSKETEFTLWMFLRRFKESNFVKFVFFVTGISFATQIAAPYFDVIMLKDFKYNYLNFTAVHLAAMVSGLISFPIWGRHADLVGNAKILKTTGLIIPLIPVLWIFSDNVIYIIAVELFSGFIWGGFNLCATNFIFDATAPEKRVRVLCYFNLIHGLAIFAGASLGGYLADHLPPLFGYPLYSLFLISAVLRLLANIILSPHFSEVRQSTKKISSHELIYSVVGIRPLLGRAKDLNNLPPLHEHPWNDS